MKRALQIQPGGRNPRARWSDEEAESLRKNLTDRQAKERMTYREMAEELDCSPETVRLLMQKQRYRGG